MAGEPQASGSAPFVGMTKNALMRKISLPREAVARAEQAPAAGGQKISS